MPNERDPWTYKGIIIYPAGINSSGIRWYARTTAGTLKADTKDGIKELINHHDAKAD